MNDPVPSSEHDAGRSLGARLLITAGALWLFLTGGCTIAFSISVLSAGEVAFVFMCILIGAFCMAPGLLMLLMGLWLPRRSQPASPAS